MKESYYERALIKNKKRARQVRRYKAILLFALSLIAIIFICISFNSFSSHATDLEHKPLIKNYKTIEIKQGDTLWSLATEYKADDDTFYEYISEVKRINALTSDKIIKGNDLLIPYYTTEYLAYEY